MKVNYEGKDYNFELEEIDVQQATVLKRRLGLTLLGLDQGLNEGDPDALRAVYWLMLTQSGERVDIDEVNFKIVKLANAVQEAVEAENEANGEGKDGDTPKDKQGD